jgi:hypothetical protein
MPKNAKTMSIPVKNRMVSIVGIAAKRINGFATGSPFIITLNCSVSG